MQTLPILCVLLAIFSHNLVNSGTLPRQRRDVSHLPLEYLPPVVLPPVPSRDYLPPVEQHAASLPHVLQPPRDYLPPVNNEYLPPVVVEKDEEEEEVPITTELATTEEATTEAALVTEAEPEVEVVTEPVEVKTHELVEEQPKEEVETAVLKDDGYHYRTPEVIPDLLPVKEYLPPLDDNAVVAEVPNSEESSALKDDGYHYRAVKRLRF